MSKKNAIKPIAAVVGAALVGSLSAVNIASAAENPFGASAMQGGYMQLAEAAATEGKCGGDKKPAEGKCGEGKCGGEKASAEGKCGGEKAGAEGKCGGEKAGAEGKCGEGKCGGAK
jgi:uncharacterized low-complexity protein